MMQQQLAHRGTAAAAPARRAAPALNSSRRRRAVRIAAIAEPAIANGNGNGAAAAVISSHTAAALATPLVVPAAPAAAPAAPALAPPAGAYARAVDAGAAKAALPWPKIFALGALAGAYIGFGALLATAVGGACPGLAATNPGVQKLLVGAFGLPTGLMMVLVCGGELFTGNTALVTAAAVEGRATVGQLAKSWAVSYAGNLFGALALVWLVWQSGVLAGAPAPKAVAAAKASLPFAAAVARGVLCNVLVCLAIWQANAASTLPGKFIGAFLPVSAFAAIGFEHSVANMFLLPMGAACGAPVTAAAIALNNLVPVTLGNVLGGCGLALAYAFAYGRLGAGVKAA